MVIIETFKTPIFFKSLASPLASFNESLKSGITGILGNTSILFCNAHFKFLIIKSL